MGNNDKKIEAISQKLESLIQRQHEFQNEISSLQQELIQIKSSTAATNRTVNTGETPSTPETNIQPKNILETPGRKPVPENPQPQKATLAQEKSQKSNFERFIGENLINKIGIAILVIGVAIGTKYAIDNQLIGPTTRIILGYILGLGLLGFAIRLKKKYEGFSAVLLSGAMAIMYFITYAAFSFYSLFPQAITFGFLVLFTIATVISAISYNRQVIAHIGLVGAYAVPFLFSHNPDKILFLFVYTAIINTGILAIAILRYWKLLYLSASAITWLLFSSWYAGAYNEESQFTLALIFLSLYFILFLATFIAYKLIRKSRFEFLDIFLLVVNSFIFYGIGFSLLNNHSIGEGYLGLFTLITATIHFIVAFIVFRDKTSDRNLFYLLSGMVLVFLTITFPVQFNGSWVTIFWAGEASILFWIGRNSKVKIYEYLSYPVILLAFGSIIQDWAVGYGTYIPEEPETRIKMFFNITFLTSMVLIASYGFIFSIDLKTAKASDSQPQGLQKMMRIITGLLLALTVYFAFRVEISTYWNQLFTDSKISFNQENSGSIQFPNKDYDLLSFKTIWLLNYTLLFMSALSFIFLIFKNEATKWIVMGINTAMIIAFLSLGLYELSELRESYLEQDMAEFFDRGIYHMLIRYVSLVFAALLLVKTHNIYTSLQKRPTIGIDYLVAGSVLWVLSSEVLHWFDVFNVPHSYKIGLSIFWGVYALLMVVFGIARRKKHIRIAAFGIIGFTLLKLFIYDLSHMPTISRAIIFILLGIVLLGVSFLYNKYKNIIINEN